MPAVTSFKSVYYGVISNPYAHNSWETKAYEFAYEIAISYALKTKNVEQFISQYRSVSEDYDSIKSQYDSLRSYEKLLKFDDVYYDCEALSIIRQKYAEIIPDSQHLYYTFPTENEVIDTVEAHNTQFVEKHLNDEVFDEVLDYKLDVEQRTAILRDESTNLVIAGAGCGKTLTICGKLKYLLAHNVKPEEILLLSFVGASEKDLDDKAKKIDTAFEAKTFHSLGYSIVKEYTNESFVVQTQFDSILAEFFEKEIECNEILQQKTIQYFGLFSASVDNREKYKTIGDFFKAVNTSDFKTLKSMVDPDEKSTLKKEIVKSYEELIIANYYYLFGINYEYERPYKHTTSTNERRDYCPDFYLPDYDIYHEHYGVDENNNCTQFSEEEAQRYLSDMEWKRNLHSEKGTVCIETYSYLVSNGTLFKYLKQTLQEKGVKFNPLSADEVWKKMKNIINGKDFTSFKTLIGTFTSLYKSMYSDESAFDKLLDLYAGNNFSAYDKMRATSLLAICKAFYLYYRKKLKYDTVEKSKEKIDFDDMILKAIQYLPDMNKHRYKYIIVDEFQDISHSRMKFLLALKNHGHSKLFLVGDDWQSIYRFSGSDIDIFINIEKYFGKTATSFISTTYRNSQELVDIAGHFVMENSEQVKKQIKAQMHRDAPIHICYFHKHKVNAFHKVLEEISLGIKENERILVLGRINKDKDYITTRETQIKEHKMIIPGFEKLNITYSTVHSSKGLEYDYVIIVNGDDSRLGFPNKIENDKLLSLVLAEESSFEYAEERRLFYVALTRTKKNCYILSEIEAVSSFVKEIEKHCQVHHWEGEEYSQEHVILCPYCYSGVIRRIESDGKYNAFYGCSNYPLCDYINRDLSETRFSRKCPRCGDYLRFGKNKKGEYYWGCNSYRAKRDSKRCNYYEAVQMTLDCEFGDKRS